VKDQGPNVLKGGCSQQVQGAVSEIFGSQVTLRVHYCKRDEVYFTTVL